MLAAGHVEGTAGLLAVVRVGDGLTMISPKL